MGLEQLGSLMFSGGSRGGGNDPYARFYYDMLKTNDQRAYEQQQAQQLAALAPHIFGNQARSAVPEVMENMGPYMGPPAQLQAPQPAQQASGLIGDPNMPPALQTLLQAQRAMVASGNPQAQQAVTDNWGGILKSLMPASGGMEPRAVSPGTVLLDRGTNQPVYTAPTKAEMGWNFDYDPETGKVSFGQGPQQGMPFGKTTNNKLDEQIRTSINMLDRLDQLGESYSEDYLTYGGKWKHGWNSFWSKMGGDLSPEQTEFVQKGRAFRSGLGQVFSEYRKYVTGAAAALAELKGLEEDMLNKNLSPVEFGGAFAQYSNLLKRQLRLAVSLKANGLTKEEITARLNRDYNVGENQSAAPSTRVSQPTGQPSPVTDADPLGLGF